MASNNTSKSGIVGPAGYNGKTPSSIAAPTKVYPGSQNLGKAGSKGSDYVEGPGDKDCKGIGEGVSGSSVEK